MQEEFQSIFDSKLSEFLKKKDSFIEYHLSKVLQKGYFISELAILEHTYFNPNHIWNCYIVVDDPKAKTLEDFNILAHLVAKISKKDEITTINFEEIPCEEQY